MSIAACVSGYSLPRTNFALIAYHPLKGVMVMAELSRDEVIAILGPLSDVVVAEIIGTGISKNELVAARARVITDRKNHDPGLPLEPGHFAKVVEILERLREHGIVGGSTLQ
jgi:hypothetical protein